MQYNSISVQITHFLVQVATLSQYIEKRILGPVCDNGKEICRILTFWRRIFFQILAHPVFKM